MKKFFHKKRMLAPVLGAVLAGLLVSPALARMGENQPCSNCHTMHNSQGGDSMAVDANGDATTTPNMALLIKTGCVACHTGTNDSTSGTPYVFDTTKNIDLAGGNFAWVNDDQTFGHNVLDINTADLLLANVPPGGSALTAQLTCAGTNGCHGDRAASTQFGAVSGAHHGKADTTDGTMNGGDLVNSYRMLLGVKGIEDSTWEKAPTASLHNQYYGIDRSLENTATVDGSGNPVTISALCAACHGTFHADVAGSDGVLTDAMNSPWIRHPTDFDMNGVTGEYADYGGATNAYLPGVPVASNDLASVRSTVFVAAGDAIVTCVSCHRVHGSPNADMLRWDYTTMEAHAGDNSTGCFACHTTKDDL